MRIYVASSWRNISQPAVIAALRETGAEVYDFRNPVPGNHGFKWSEIDPEWKAWDPRTFREALGNQLAEEGFARDMAALTASDVCVLVLPCGRSAHIEAGYSKGAGSTLIVLLAPGEPELMYKMADFICTDLGEVVSVVSLMCKGERLERAARRASARQSSV